MSKTTTPKRLLALMLCLCMVLGMAPAAALATEEPASGYAVDIGGTVTAYTDFNEAIGAACAAEAATLTLHQDVEVSSCWFVGGNVTLDLNGKTVNSRPTVKECTLTVTDTAEIKGTVVNYSGAAFDYVSGKLIILDTTDCFGAGEGHDPWRINRNFGAAADAGTIGTTGTEDIVIPAGCEAFDYLTKAPVTLLPPAGCSVFIHRHTWVDATCTTPKTCTGCGATEGDPSSHSLGEDGKCAGCGEMVVCSVNIGGTVAGYTTFREAVDAVCAAEAATLTLHQDVEETLSWFVGGNVTLDLNGKTVNGRLIVKGCTLTVTDTAEIKGTVVNFSGSAFDYVSGKLIILDTTDCFGAGEGHASWKINRGAGAAADAGTIGTTGTEDIVLPAGCVAFNIQTKAPITLLPSAGGTAVIHRHTWVDATCTAPKTCTSCGAVEGEALGHSFGEDDICLNCGAYKNSITINMTDSYGDGWNGNAIAIYEDGVPVATITVESGSTATWTCKYDPEKKYSFYWVKGDFANECFFEIAIYGEVVFEASADDCSGYSNCGYRL